MFLLDPRIPGGNNTSVAFFFARTLLELVESFGGAEWFPMVYTDREIQPLVQ